MHNVYHSLGELSPGAVAGITIAIAIAFVVTTFIVVTVVISCYEWKGLFLCYLYGSTLTHIYITLQLMR